MNTFDIPITIICDMKENTVTPQMISINQKEENVKKLQVEFVADGKPWKIPSGFSCNVLMKKENDIIVNIPAEHISGNIAVFEITPRMTSIVGENCFHIQLVKSKDETRDFRMGLYISKDVLNKHNIISDDEKEILNGLIDRIKKVAEGERKEDSCADKCYNVAQRTSKISDTIGETATETLINDKIPSDITTYSSNKSKKIESDFLKKQIVVTEAGTNCDDYTKSGVYYFSSSYRPINIPLGSNGWLIVLNGVTSSAVKQIWMLNETLERNDYMTYVRTQNQASWGKWEQYAMTSQVEELQNQASFDEYCNSITELRQEYKTNLIDLQHLGINAAKAEAYDPNGKNHLTQEGDNLFGQKVVNPFDGGYKNSQTEFYNENYNVGIDLFSRYSEFENLLPIYTNLSSFGGYYYNLIKGNNVSIPIHLDTNLYYYFRCVLYYNGTTNVTVKLHDNTTNKDVEKKVFVVSSYTDVTMNFYSADSVFNADHEYVVIITTSIVNVNCGPLSLTLNGICDYNKVLPNTRISWTNVNFYIDGFNGSDANPGTKSKPFKTIDRFIEMYRYYAEIRLFFVGDCDEYSINKCETLCNVGLHIMNETSKANVTIHFNGRYTPAFYNSHVNIGGKADKYFTFDIPNNLYFDGGFGMLANYTKFTGGNLAFNGCGAELLYCTFNGILNANVANVYLRGCVFEGNMGANMMTFLNSNVYLRTSFTFNGEVPDDYYVMSAIGSRVTAEVSLIGNTTKSHKIAIAGTLFLCNNRQWNTWTSDGLYASNSFRLGETYNYLNNK